mgnify:CR=1 FL=1
MTENLRTNLYRDGSSISSKPLDTTIGAYGLYPHLSIDEINSDEEMATAYGRLYNSTLTDLRFRI